MAEGDHYRLTREEQRKGLPVRMPSELRKYIVAQRLLCDWLPYEVAPETVVKSPNELYKLMWEIGLRWDNHNNYWRLRPGFKEPTSYFDTTD